MFCLRLIEEVDYKNENHNNQQGKYIFAPWGYTIESHNFLSLGQSGITLGIQKLARLRPKLLKVHIAQSIV